MALRCPSCGRHYLKLPPGREPREDDICARCRGEVPERGLGDSRNQNIDGDDPKLPEWARDEELPF